MMPTVVRKALTLLGLDYGGPLPYDDWRARVESVCPGAAVEAVSRCGIEDELVIFTGRHVRGGLVVSAMEDDR